MVIGLEPSWRLLTSIAPGVGMFKTRARTAGAPQAHLLTVVSLRDLSTWPSNSCQTPYVVGEDSQRGNPNRNQQKWHFLPQKSPSITSITFFSLRQSPRPGYSLVKNVKGFTKCFENHSDPQNTTLVLFLWGATIIFTLVSLDNWHSSLSFWSVFLLLFSSGTPNFISIMASSGGWQIRKKEPKDLYL